MNATLRILGVLVAGAVALAVVQQLGRERADAGGLTAPGADTIEVAEAVRRAGLRFDPSLAAEDRRWILGAIAQARPEAARLIAEVDGLVLFSAHIDRREMLGVTQGGASGFTIGLNLPRLDGDRTGDRATVVLHELGHVIDFALVPDATNARLDAEIPRGGPCGVMVGCDRIEERFADTFAKWALKGAVSEVGAGYGIRMPASLEDWGSPLSDLSFSLAAA